MRRLIAQLARFGVVGAIGFVVDTGLFNLLRATVLSPDDVHAGPFIAKVISTIVAIFVNWMGNRYWTFRDQRRSVATREGIEFVVVSLGGMVISLGCLGLSHYVFGFTSALADNISGNVIGLVLGTAFRFWLYKVWVYHPDRTERQPADETTGTTSTTGTSSTTSTTPTSAAPATATTER
ncbi:GtrA family protein [Curtobacterium sp. PhB136]|uniref:GtrA family protein n=1 Tax=Curtobacterium sp. PhB136 TaxID=2485181 RepID=UPI0010515CC9|nr:GtrA family protein [Curtobacterium sp. PhB136]TCK59700.1 putative flippase GtrA [Curtobacterium sp. PhB136]